MIFRKTLFSLSFLLGSVCQTASAEQNSDAEAILLKKITEAKIYPRSECISAVREEEMEGWTSVALREKHDKRCGGDPDVAPLLDRFRIQTKTNIIEYYNPLEDGYESFAKFLRKKKKP